MQYKLGRLPEARRTYERLVSTKAIKGGDLRWITYYLAFVAAAQGDTARVSTLVRQLASEPSPYFGGTHSFNEARLAAMRGQRERATELIQLSIAEGRAFDQTIHTMHEFERLWGYKPFEEWLKPNG